MKACGYIGIALLSVCAGCYQPTRDSTKTYYVIRTITIPQTVTTSQVMVAIATLDSVVETAHKRFPLSKEGAGTFSMALAESSAATAGERYDLFHYRTHTEYYRHGPAMPKTNDWGGKIEVVPLQDGNVHLVFISVKSGLPFEERESRAIHRSVGKVYEALREQVPDLPPASKMRETSGVLVTDPENPLIVRVEERPKHRLGRTIAGIIVVGLCICVAKLAIARAGRSPKGAGRG